MKTYTLKPLYKKPLYKEHVYHIWLEFNFSTLQKPL